MPQFFAHYLPHLLSCSLQKSQHLYELFSTRKSSSFFEYPETKSSQFDLLSDVLGLISMFNVHCDVNAEVDRNVHGLICAVGIVLCDVQCNIQ